MKGVESERFPEKSPSSPTAKGSTHTKHVGLEHWTASHTLDRDEVAWELRGSQARELRCQVPAQVACDSRTNTSFYQEQGGLEVSSRSWDPSLVCVHLSSPCGLDAQAHKWVALCPAASRSKRSRDDLHSSSCWALLRTQHLQIPDVS